MLAAFSKYIYIVLFKMKLSTFRFIRLQSVIEPFVIYEMYLKKWKSNKTNHSERAKHFMILLNTISNNLKNRSVNAVAITVDMILIM